MSWIQQILRTSTLLGIEYRSLEFPPLPFYAAEAGLTPFMNQHEKTNTYKMNPLVATV